MKTYTILLLFCISVSECIYSQKFTEPIHYRFKNGETGYISFFSENIAFPASSMKNGTIANSITRIALNPNGEIDEITVINPVDTNIDKEVLRVIDLSKNFWMKCDTVKRDQVFYIQIAFSLPGFEPNLFKPKTHEIMKFFPEPVLITSTEPIPANLSGENASGVIKSEVLSEKANNYLDSGKLEEALPYISELIKRDPFNRDLYKVRIMINVKLNRPELVVQDDNKIINFAEGFSIDELNKARE